MTRPNRLVTMDALLALAIGVAVAALAVALRTPWHSWGDDFAAYLLQARAMAAGQVRAEVLLNGSLVVASDSLPVPSAYPWGLPTLLWMGASVGGWELIRLKVIGALALGAATAFTFLLSRGYLSRAGSLVAAALVGLQPLVLKSADLLLSDLPFLGATAAALLCMDRVYRALDDDRRAIGGSLLAAALTVAAFAIRANGVALAGSFLLMLGYSWWAAPAGRASVARAGVLYAAASALLVVLYYAWSPGDAIGSYAALSVLSPGSVGGMAVATGLLVPRFMPLALLPNSSTVLVLGGVGVCLSLVALGTWIRRPYAMGLALFIALDLVLLVVMPFVQGVRYLFPLLIPGVILSLAGVQFLWASVHNPLRRWPALVRRAEAWAPAMAVVVVLALGAHSYRVAGQPKSYQLDGPYSEVSQELVRYVIAHVPAGERIAFFRPRAMRLLTGRPSLAIREPDHADRAAYFVLTKWQPPESRELLAKYQLGPVYFAGHAAEYERLFENGQFVLYHRVNARTEPQPTQGR